MAHGLAEKYLRETWPVVTQALKEHGISCELNLVSSVLSLSFNDRMSVGLHVFRMQNN
jgi:rRNA processing protein Krr1/Pno1